MVGFTNLLLYIVYAKNIIFKTFPVHDVPEVIEESICEEVNTQKQEFEEQKEEIVYDKSNKKCEKTKKSKNESKISAKCLHFIWL